MIAIEAMGKRYATEAGSLAVLKGVSLQIARGEFVAITGQSGSGKSTLMNIIGCLDSADEGRYAFDGRDVTGLGADELAALRNRHVGFVFQSFNLVSRMSAARNVELPMVYAGIERGLRQERARERLVAVGLGERLEHLPAQLSGGQQQRVAIARALVNDPELLIADEPTGSLDSRTGEDIMTLFEELNRAGKTILMVTHEPGVAARAGRRVHLRDGEIAQP